MKTRIAFVLVAVAVALGLGAFFGSTSYAYVPPYSWQLSPFQSCNPPLVCADCCETGSSICYQSQCLAASQIGKACTPAID